MRKKILRFAAALLLIIELVTCGNNSGSKDSANKADDTTLKVDVSPAPYAEILEHVKLLLKGEGIDLKAVKFDDYVLSNQSLEEDDIDANYFQHIPYLDKEIKEGGYDFVNTGAVHIEPMGLHSRKIKDVSELEDGTAIITSDSESDWGCIITIPQDAGLIKIKGGVDLGTATFDDTEENPKNLKFNHMIDPSLLAPTYQNNESDLVAINANFAYGAGLNPLEDAVSLEKDNFPYVNTIATRKGSEDSDKIKGLIEILHRGEV